MRLDVPVPPGPGDLVAWRRTKGPRQSTGYGIVTSVDRGTVTVVPITGSTSHTLRRPVRDVHRLITRADLIKGLSEELARSPW